MARSVFDGVLLPPLPQGWLTERSARHVQEPNPQAIDNPASAVFDGVLLPHLPQGWLTERSAHHVQEPNPQAINLFCHQCRRTDNPRPRYLCGRATCVRAFCIGCLERRYKWTPHDIHLRGCPVCRRVCNCSKCLTATGLRSHVKPLAALVRHGGCPREWLEKRNLLVERTDARREIPMPTGKLHGVHAGMTPRMEVVDGRQGSICASPAGQEELEVRSLQEDNAHYEQVRKRKRRQLTAPHTPPPARTTTAVERRGSAGTSARPTATSAASLKPPIALEAQHRNIFASKCSNAAGDVIEISDSGSDGAGFVTPLRKGAKVGKPLRGRPSTFSAPRPVPEVVDDAAQMFYLRPLLNECGQQAPYTFDSFLEVFRFDELHAHAEPSTMVYRKLGEASFSEVYAIGDVVLKVVPLRNGERQAEGEGEDPEELGAPEESGMQDFLREMRITRELNALCSGFVELLKAYVVCGTYPEQLLKQWDEYDDRRKSGSIRPDSFPASQAYGVLVLPNLGTDLEAFVFKAGSGWAQASTIFWQVARTLCTAEQRVQFEHRDLHWGQVLVRDNGAGGVRATVIDLGLSRMQVSAGDAPLWTPIDDEILEGEGDYQFTIYRMMRDHNAGDWEAFHPLTNVMWMHYLAMKLTQGKKLRTPATAAERNCAGGLVEVQELLASSVAATLSPHDAAKKTSHIFLCVADLVRWAEERGWMKMAL